ncbi:MAG: DUF2726 domain-containing protein [Burkholderiales bacterium]|nr:DUF2726 domain-containing protein [Burkholderiales bacterium]
MEFIFVLCVGLVVAGIYLKKVSDAEKRLKSFDVSSKPSLNKDKIIYDDKTEDLYGLFKSEKSESSDDALERELKTTWPLRSNSIMTRIEVKVFDALRAALPEHYIFPQVSLAQLIKVKSGQSTSRQYSLFGRYARMSVDFVVCDQNYQLVCGIEIDDSTHQRADRVRADRIKNHVFKSAGIHLVRWKIAQIENLTDRDIFNQIVLEK